jgi:hypothetical protein
MSCGVVPAGVAACLSQSSEAEGKIVAVHRPLEAKERLGTGLFVSFGYSDCFLGRQWTRLLV